MFLIRKHTSLSHLSTFLSPSASVTLITCCYLEQFFFLEFSQERNREGEERLKKKAILSKNKNDQLIIITNLLCVLTRKKGVMLWKFPGIKNLLLFSFFLFPFFFLSLSQISLRFFSPFFSFSFSFLFLYGSEFFLSLSRCKLSLFLNKIKIKKI